MACTKTKTAIIGGAIVLLTIGTATVTIEKLHAGQIQKTADGAIDWQITALTRDNKTLESMPPMVDIFPTKFPNGGGWRMGRRNKIAGLNHSVADIILMAYGYIQPVDKRARMILETDLPGGKYDFISSVSSNAAEALQEKIKEKFGVVAKREIRQTDALVLRVKTPNAPGLKPSNAGPNSGWSSGEGGTWTDAPMQGVASWLEAALNTPVIDQTGLKRRYNIDLQLSKGTGNSHDVIGQRQLARQVVLDQLGLELVPTNMPVEMLVVEKAK